MPQFIGNPPPHPVNGPGAGQLGFHAVDDEGNRLPVVDSRFANDFVALLSAQGVTITQTARAIGVDPQLLINVAQKRQALPVDVAKAIASFLPAYSLGTILGAAGLVTMQTGPDIRVAIPVDALDGSQLVSFVQLGHTQPNPIPGPPITGLVIVGENLCTGGGGPNTVDGYVLLNPESGALVEGPLPTLFLDTGGLDPRSFCFGSGGKLYAPGYFTHRIWQTVLDVPGSSFTNTGHENDNGLASVLACAYEPNTDSVWFGNSSFLSPGMFIQITPDPNFAGIHAPYYTPIAGDDASVFDVCAWNGKVYAAITNPGLSDGALYEIDPEIAIRGLGGDVIRGGIGMLWPRGVAHDGEGHFVVTDILHGSFWVCFARGTFVPLSLAAPANIGLPNNLTRIAFHRGEFWFTYDDGAGGMRLGRMKIKFDDAFELIDPTLAIVVTESHWYNVSGSEQGYTAVDGDGRVWYSSPSDGTVSLLNPIGVADGGDPVVRVYTTGGGPKAMLWL